MRFDRVSMQNEGVSTCQLVPPRHLQGFSKYKTSVAFIFLRGLNNSEIVLFYQTVDSWPSDAEVEDEVFGEKQDDIKDKEFTDIILTEIAETMEEENEDSRASRRTVKFQGIESEV